MTIGLIGLGNMGFHYGVRLLAAGHRLAVYDTNASVVATLVDKGAEAATSAHDLADRADILLLSLPTPAIVDAVVAEIAREPVRATIVADLSTTGPVAARAAAKALARIGVAFVGAPVSGGVIAAEKGKLTIMASGPAEHVRAIRSVLDVIGTNVFVLGEDPGSGQVMKILNNTLSAVSAVAGFEALVFGAKAGLDAKTMLDIINVSSGRSFATQEKIPQCILHRDFPMRFATELMHKDVKLCLDEAERIGATMVMGPAARHFFSFAISQGDGPRDYAHLIEHFERWAGAQFGEARPAEPDGGPGSREG